MDYLQITKQCNIKNEDLSDVIGFGKQFSKSHKLYFFDKRGMIKKYNMLKNTWKDFIDLSRKEFNASQSQDEAKMCKLHFAYFDPLDVNRIFIIATFHPSCIWINAIQKRHFMIQGKVKEKIFDEDAKYVECLMEFLIKKTDNKENNDRRPENGEEGPKKLEEKDLIVIEEKFTPSNISIPNKYQLVFSKIFISFPKETDKPILSCPVIHLDELKNNFSLFVAYNIEESENHVHYPIKDHGIFKFTFNMCNEYDNYLNLTEMEILGFTIPFREETLIVSVHQKKPIEMYSIIEYKKGYDVQHLPVLFQSPSRILLENGLFNLCGIFFFRTAEDMLYYGTKTTTYLENEKGINMHVKKICKISSNAMFITSYSTIHPINLLILHTINLDSANEFTLSSCNFLLSQKNILQDLKQEKEFSMVRMDKVLSPPMEVSIDEIKENIITIFKSMMNQLKLTNNIYSLTIMDLQGTGFHISSKFEGKYISNILYNDTTSTNSDNTSHYKYNNSIIRCLMSLYSTEGLLPDIISIGPLKIEIVDNRMPFLYPIGCIYLQRKQPQFLIYFEHEDKEIAEKVTLCLSKRFSDLLRDTAIFKKKKIDKPNNTVVKKKKKWFSFQ